MAILVRVLHFPDWRSGNPYQSLLADALDVQGIEVAFSSHCGALFPITRSVRASPSDLLHLHWVADLFGANDPNLARHLLKQMLFRFDVLLARRLMSGRLVWSVHNLTSHECRYPSRDLAARRFLAAKVARIIVHGARARPEVAASYGVSRGRVAVVVHGSYGGVYPAGIGRGRARRHLKIPDDRVVFLFLGTMRSYKGIEELVEGFAQLRDPRKHLVLAGEPPDHAYLESIRARCRPESLTLYGQRVADDELQTLFAAADVVVLPFKNVLTSGSLILAMTFGRMVVAPRLGCIPDYLDPLGGILYDPSTAGALEAALAEALACPDRDTRGRHNRERAMQLDWASTASETIRIYNDVFNGNPTR